MKLKKASYKNGRGYCGYHIGYFGQKVYCRSNLEKVFCLLLDEEKIPYLCEKQVFYFGDVSYKPDFFIYEDEKFEKLIKIVEIKGSEDEKENYDKLFISEFSKIGIKWECKIINVGKFREKFKDEIEEHKKNSNSYIMTGERNPRFGMECSKEFCKKHSKTMIEKWKDPDFRSKVIENTRKGMASPEIRKKMRDARKISGKKQKEESEHKRIRKFGNFENRKCSFCGKFFKIREKIERNYCFSRKCIMKYKISSGYKPRTFSGEESKKRFKQMLFKIANKSFSLEELNEKDLPILRKERLYNNSPFSLNSIKKYFGSLEKFKGKLKEWQKLNQ